MNTDLINRSQTLIGKGEIKQAITLLVDNFPKYKNKLTHVMGWLSRIEKEKNAGIINFEDFTLQENKISSSLLNYIDEIKKDNENDIPKRNSEKLVNKLIHLSEINTGNELLKMLRCSNALIIDNDPIVNQKEIEVVSNITSYLEDNLELFGLDDIFITKKELLDIEVKFNIKIDNLNKGGFLIFAKVIDLIKIGDFKYKKLVVKIANNLSTNIIKDEQSNKNIIVAILE